MSLFGVFMGVYMIFVFQQNRKEFTRLRDEAEDRKRIIQTQSMASVRSASKNANKNQSKSNSSRYAYTGMKSSPANDLADGYDSDDMDDGAFYEPRSRNNPIS